MPAEIERKLNTAQYNNAQRGGFVKWSLYRNCLTSNKYLCSAIYASLETLSMQVGW